VRKEKFGMFIPAKFIGLLALVFVLNAPPAFAEDSEHERRKQAGPAEAEQRIVGVARPRIADGGIGLDVIDDRHLTHFWLENVEEMVCSRPDMPYPYKCAFRGLGEIAQGRTVVCTTKGVQHRWPNWFLARCSVDGVDIGEEMVRKGYAHRVDRGWSMMAGRWQWGQPGPVGGGPPGLVSAVVAQHEYREQDDSAHMIGSGIAHELVMLGAVIAVSIALALLKPLRRWATRD
jgi:hypothetical protein